jgi:hypothetical protein
MMVIVNCGEVIEVSLKIESLMLMSVLHLFLGPDHVFYY